jgi:molybdopterin/thiamine biosynthesis adenylyltransferase
MSVGDQLTLFHNSVAVIGCGSLGRYVIEELARLGVGRIVVVDPGLFEEHDLNQQLFSNPSNLGQAKVQAAVLRVGVINPAVNLVPIQAALSPKNGTDLLEGCRVAVDAQDNLKGRLELAEICVGLNILLVHGAIFDWVGHVSTHTQYPGDDTLQIIYRSWKACNDVEGQPGSCRGMQAVVG